ncbi:hypothetical protein I6A60_03565 [Frankia sp. AgB1.9]|uniref:hypothetical protein n=1 Tax=unclassified Frankia TaxID=2632575 RepID=UPI0019348E2E|nr:MULTISPECIES: hypothetical protein [unclassified Frankia]MBL7491946.1 hypothetical protein [Frankia sp. AgW1.1]MBL7546961.1 hypothetical protein [Frankia sp. AgB1.9]MBL7620606.1 hypothetical protein [Frankia sp. AgB1.8]
MSRPSGPAERDVLDTLRRALTTLPRPNLLTIAWRWRYETIAIIGCGAVVVGLLTAVGPWWTLAIILGTAAFAAVTPRLRAWAADRAWVVMVQHRVRVGCRNAWVHSRDGKLPAVLWTSARPYGERVVLWCPPGISFDDLEDARHLLAVACWATEVVVEPDPVRAHIVVLHVVRGGKPGP